MKLRIISLLAISLLSPIALSADSKVCKFGKVVHFEDNKKRGASAMDAFKQATKESNLVVVDFYAPWCGPCKQLSPIIDKLAQEFPDVKFLKVNTEASQDVASFYNIRSIPQLFFFKNGVLQADATLRGKPTKATIVKTIKKYS